MGTFHYEIEVGDFAGAHFEPVSALIDTGATYTWLPKDLLERLGVVPEEERPFVLANGQQVNYWLAWIRVRVEGRAQPTIAIFGDPGSEPLLGVFTLEGFGLAVDPVNHRLVPVTGYLVGVR